MHEYNYSHWPTTTYGNGLWHTEDACGEAMATGSNLHLPSWSFPSWSGQGAARVSKPSLQGKTEALYALYDGIVTNLSLTQPLPLNVIWGPSYTVYHALIRIMHLTRACFLTRALRHVLTTSLLLQRHKGPFCLITGTTMAAVCKDTKAP